MLMIMEHYMTRDMEYGTSKTEIKDGEKENCCSMHDWCQSICLRGRQKTVASTNMNSFG